MKWGQRVNDYIFKEYTDDALPLSKGELRRSVKNKKVETQQIQRLFLLQVGIVMSKE